MQVEGKNGFPALVAKVKTGGVPVLYHGALAASAATFVGHYPWFFTVSPCPALLCHGVGTCSCALCPVLASYPILLLCLLSCTASLPVETCTPHAVHA